MCCERRRVPEQAWRQSQRPREASELAASVRDRSLRDAPRQPNGLWHVTPLYPWRLLSRRPRSCLSSSVKFLKAARDSEERRKVPGRTDGCLCPPPSPCPPPRVSSAAAASVCSSQPLNLPRPPASSQSRAASPSLQRGNSLWLRRARELKLHVARAAPGARRPGSCFSGRCSQNLAG